MFSRLLAVMLSLAGCSKRVDSAPVPTITNVEQQNKVFQEGCDLIESYMRLEGKKSRPVDADARVKINRGIKLLGAVTLHAPSHWNSYWVQGKGFQALGDAPAACDAFKAAFDIQQENADVAREYMFECLSLGRGPEGLRAAKLAIELRPNDPGLYANLALAYLIAGDAPAALKAVEESLRLDPADAVSQNVKKVTRQIIDGKRSPPKRLGDLGG